MREDERFSGVHERIGGVGHENRQQEDRADREIESEKEPGGGVTERHEADEPADHDEPDAEIAECGSIQAQLARHLPASAQFAKQVHQQAILPAVDM